jgi:hypothetical protein
MLTPTFDAWSLPEAAFNSVVAFLANSEICAFVFALVMQD